MGEDITPEQFANTKKAVNKQFSPLGMSVDLQTKHFKKRVDDNRNVKPISSAELIAIGEGTPESLAAIEMIIMATGACSEVSTLEIVDSKSMTAAMETANKVVSAYQAPNK